MTSTITTFLHGDPHGDLHGEPHGEPHGELHGEPHLTTQNEEVIGGLLGPWWTSWYFEDFLVTCGSLVNFVVTPIRIKPLVM